MYVFYPASRLVGLTIYSSEINQACPFSAKTPKAELEHKSQIDKNLFEETSTQDQRIIQTSDYQDSKSDYFSKQSILPCPKTANSQSESPDIAPKKPPRKKKIGKNQREIEKSPETISLEENLKKLEVYRATKPTSVKRSWSLHFKKTVTSDFIKMAGSDYTLKDMTHPALNDTLKSHNAVTFKLVKIMGEFTESLGHASEQYAEELQLLVSNFRKKNSELRKERPPCASSLFHTWETLLQDVEIDSQAHSEIASILGRQVSRPLTENTFFRKIQSRKVFSHRDAYESLIKLNEEKLAKTRIEYKTSYLAYMNNPSSQTLANYIASHNEYVSQLHVTNGVLNQYHSEILPSLLQEIEDIYNDLCVKISDSILQVAETVSSRAQEQGKRYEQLTAQCRSVQGSTDLAHLVRSVTIPVNHPPTRRHFTPPQPPSAQIGTDGQQLSADSTTTANQPPVLKNEIVLDRTTSAQIKEKYESAKKEFHDLETQVKQLSDALHTLTRVQQRSMDSNLFNKVNEIQEDISVKQHELNLVLMRLSGVRAQTSSALEGLVGRLDVQNQSFKNRRCFLM